MPTLWFEELYDLLENVGVSNTLPGVVEARGVNKHDGATSTLIDVVGRLDVECFGLLTVTDANFLVVGKELDELHARSISLCRANL